MGENKSIYENAERKRELLGMLRDQHIAMTHATGVLEQKAWRVLEVTSGTIGIVSGLLITTIGTDAPINFWIGVGALLFLYIIQLRQVLEAIKPMKWPQIPGSKEDGTLSFEGLMEKYFEQNPKEDGFLNQLIADYAGHQDINNKERFVLGGLQKTEANNRVKAKRLRLASLLLGVIVSGLIGLSIAVVIFRMI